MSDETVEDQGMLRAASPSLTQRIATRANVFPDPPKTIEEEFEDQEILSIAAGCEEPDTLLTSQDVEAEVKRAWTEHKDTNPKDAVGTKKIPLSTVPATVMREVGVGMLEGARKYGRHNYRVSGVRGSVYYDGAMRHLTDWWEGRDIDPDSGLHEITKAICSLVVLRDAMIQDKLIDDRPPPVPATHRIALQAVVDEIFERHPDSKPAFIRGDIK